MKLLFFSLASAVYMYYIRSTMESFGCLKSGLTLDLDMAFMAYFTKRQRVSYGFGDFIFNSKFGPHLVGIGFYVSKSAKCVHTTLQYSLTKKKREREMMYVRAYVCKKGSLCIYSGKNENCANY